MSYSFNTSGFATYPAGTLLVYKKGGTITAEEGKQYDTLHYAPGQVSSGSRPGFTAYETLDPTPYMTTPGYQISGAPSQGTYVGADGKTYSNETGQDVSLPQTPINQTNYQTNNSNMSLPITYQGQTYDLGTTSGMAAYKAAMGITDSTPMAPQSQTDRLISTYNQNGSITPTQISQAMAPTNAAEVNYINSVNMPTAQSQIGDISNASAATAGYQKMLDMLYDQQKDYQGQLQQYQAQQQELTNSFMGQLQNQQSPAEVRQNAWNQTGIQPTQYFTEERAKIEEISSLTQEYNAEKAKMEAAKAQAYDVLGTTGFINNRMAQIERNAANLSWSIV